MSIIGRRRPRNHIITPTEPSPFTQLNFLQNPLDSFDDFTTFPRSVGLNHHNPSILQTTRRKRKRTSKLFKTNKKFKNSISFYL